MGRLLQNNRAIFESKQEYTWFGSIVGLNKQKYVQKTL